MESGSIRPLTGLRFVAAATIVIFHGLPASRLAPEIQPLDNAVSFFFVLSGFVLAYRYPRLESWADAKRFLIFRLARVWPAHALMAIVAAIVFPAFDLLLIPNLLLVHGWVPIRNWFFSYNLVSWSLSTEFFFYLAFVLLIPKWSRTLWWKLPACAGLLYLLMVAVVWLQLPERAPDAPSVLGVVYVNPLARLLEFAAGMATCTAFRALYPRLRDVPAWLFTIAEVGLLATVPAVILSGALERLVAAVPYLSAFYLDRAGCWPILALALLVFAFQRGYLSRFIGSAPFVLLGEASYALYLVHVTVFTLILRHFAIIGWPAFIACALASQAVALGVHFAAERPARNFIRRRFGYGPARPAENAVMPRLVPKLPA